MSILNDHRNHLIEEFYQQLKRGVITSDEYTTQVTAIKSIYKTLEERKNDASIN